METTDITIEDFYYTPGDTLSDRKLLTTAELMREWDISLPLANGKSWINTTGIDWDLRCREAKKRELIWKRNVLQMVNNNRLSIHYDFALELAAIDAGIGYITQHHKVN